MQYFKSYFQNFLLSMLGLIAALFLFEAVLSAAGFWNGAKRHFTYPPGQSDRLELCGKSFLFKTNAKGIRYRNIPDKKTLAAEKRIVVIGDSFTEGAGVEENETFSARLEKTFSRPKQPVLFVNCGISGASPFEYANILYHVGLSYHPDKVIVMLYANDLEDTVREAGANPDFERLPVIQENNYEVLKPRGWKRAPYFFWPRIYTLASCAAHSVWEKFRPVSGPLIESTVGVARLQKISEPRIQEWKTKIESKKLITDDADELNDDRFTLGLFWPTEWTESFDFEGADMQRRWQAARKALLEIVKTCRDRNIDIAFIYAPHPYQYDPYYDRVPEELGVIVRKKWLKEETELEKRIRVFCEENNIPFLNTTPDFRLHVKSAEDVLNFHINPHWNASGHALAAQVIEKWLRSIWTDLQKD